MVKADISPSIVVANLPDLTLLPRFRTSPSPTVTPARIEAFNRVIAEETRTAGGSLVDLHASPVKDDLVFDVDGFHPNNVGHRELSRQFLQVVLPKTLKR
jgi:phospholipase/lecithinase/hemolysin